MYNVNLMNVPTFAAVVNNRYLFANDAKTFLLLEKVYLFTSYELINFINCKK